jgi:hypothetical protein
MARQVSSGKNLTAGTCVNKILKFMDQRASTLLSKKKEHTFFPSKKEPHWCRCKGIPTHDHQADPWPSGVYSVDYGAP